MGLGSRPILEQMTREDITKQEGWAEGKEVGWEEGKRVGKEEGREEGKREGIFAMISFLHEMNISPSETFQELQSRFQLSEEEVNAYLDKYMAQNQDKI